MFVGHFGVALAAKRVAPRTSLPVLFLAAQFLDVLWPAFLLAGVEHARIVPGITAASPLDLYDFPFSHSLVAALGWAAGFGIAYFFFRRDARVGWVLAALVLSHWALDAIVHRPDLPLFPGGRARFGCALWDSVAGTISVEGAIFLCGILLYHRATRAADRTGSYSFWSLMALLGLLWLGNVFGPPPPSMMAVAATGLGGSLILFAWAWWIERHRLSRS